MDGANESGVTTLLSGDAGDAPQQNGVTTQTDTPGTDNNVPLGNADAGQQPMQPGTQPQQSGAPEAYEAFTLPEGVDGNDPQLQAAMGEAQALFRELGLGQEQGQKLIDLHMKHWMGGAVAAEEEFNRQVQARIDQWGKQVQTDQEWGGAHLNESKMLVNRAISALGGERLYKALTNETGVINHPAVFAAFAKMGRDYFKEDRFVQGSTGTGPVDNSPSGMAARVYPNMRRGF